MYVIVIPLAAALHCGIRKWLPEPSGIKPYDKMINPSVISAPPIRKWSHQKVRIAQKLETGGKSKPDSV